MQDVLRCTLIQVQLSRYCTPSPDPPAPPHPHLSPQPFTPSPPHSSNTYRPSAFGQIPVSPPRVTPRAILRPHRGARPRLAPSAFPVSPASPLPELALGAKTCTASPRPSAPAPVTGQPFKASPSAQEAAGDSAPPVRLPPRRPRRLPPATPPVSPIFRGPRAPPLRPPLRGTPHSLLSGAQRRRGEAARSGTAFPGPRRRPRASARAHPALRPGRLCGRHRDDAGQSGRAGGASRPREAFLSTAPGHVTSRPRLPPKSGPEPRPGRRWTPPLRLTSDAPPSSRCSPKPLDLGTAVCNVWRWVSHAKGPNAQITASRYLVGRSGNFFF